jgi:hypothetical protein
MMVFVERSRGVKKGGEEERKMRIPNRTQDGKKRTQEGKEEVWRAKQRPRSSVWQHI